MEVLVFHQHFKLPSQAGSSRMFKFAKGLSAKGHSVTIITGASCRDGVAAMGLTFKVKNLLSWEFFIEEKIRVISLNDFYDQKYSFSFRIASFITFVILSVILSLQQTRADIVFASSTPLSIVIPAIIYSKLNKIPFVFEVRDIWPEAPIQLGVLKNKILIAAAIKIEKMAYKYADAIIGISKGICRKVSVKSGKSVTFIPNAVDEEFFELRGSINRLVDNGSPLKVVYAGSCGYNNAIETIFEVARKALNDREIASLVAFTIVGDGPALQKLRNEKPSNLKLKGKISKSKTVEALVNSDIALFSQRKVSNGDLKKDSLGNKYFDFIGASLPIIAGAVSDGEMAREIIENSCGIVVEPEDIDGLYVAVKKLILSNEMRKYMSTASGNLALKYTRKDQTAKFISLLEDSLINPRRIKQ